jgi:ArsR family transcriptional regulator, arsenate/arsenite/antimonite-responsive transcriptional repressor
MYFMRDLALFYTALADKSRLRLINLMKNGEICVCHLQGVLKTNQPKISRHLAYLRKAGLVAARRDGKWTHYRLKKPVLNLGKILSQTLIHLRSDHQIKKDDQRLKRLMHCPSRYGFSSPNRKGCE